ncbi:hypothetical protein NPIL_258611 [Nephila pilipes]|uniref:Uncharacterized protein n=1 Tax=Nephila pilipes TaxID=299642 RepID=A0A8X6QLQ0_NEPPI|nr:hypothetical protein NPIL_258611 [Nephila pilipes]
MYLDITLLLIFDRGYPYIAAVLLQNPSGSRFYLQMFFLVVFQDISFLDETARSFRILEIFQTVERENFEHTDHLSYLVDLNPIENSWLLLVDIFQKGISPFELCRNSKSP